MSTRRIEVTKRRISAQMSTARGRVAALSIFHDDNHPDVVAAKQQLRFIKISEFLERELAQEPWLTAGQIGELGAYLRDRGDLR